jgi:hypothetical protein
MKLLNIIYGHTNVGNIGDRIYYFPFPSMSIWLMALTRIILKKRSFDEPLTHQNSFSILFVLILISAFQGKTNQKKGEIKTSLCFLETFGEAQ